MLLVKRQHAPGRLLRMFVIVLAALAHGETDGRLSQLEPRVRQRLLHVHAVVGARCEYRHTLLGHSFCVVNAARALVGRADKEVCFEAPVERMLSL